MTRFGSDGGGDSQPFDPDFLSLPAGKKRQSFSRRAPYASSSRTPTVQRENLTFIACDQGDVLTGIAFTAGAVGGAGMTHLWYTLRDAAGVLLGVTADDTSATWTIGAERRLAFASPVTIPARGVYYAGVVVGTATTLPQLTGALSANGISSPTPMIYGLGTATGLVTPNNAVTTETFVPSQGNLLYVTLD